MERPTKRWRMPNASPDSHPAHVVWCPSAHSGHMILSDYQDQCLPDLEPRELNCHEFKPLIPRFAATSCSHVPTSRPLLNANHLSTDGFLERKYSVNKVL